MIGIEPRANPGRPSRPSSVRGGAECAGGALAPLLLAGVMFAGNGCREAGAPPSAVPPASQPAGVAWVEDVTDRVGLHFVHDVGPLGTYFMPESVGSGAAIFDFNNDGRMDVLLLQNAGTNSASKHQLFRQNGDGRFENVSVGSGLDLPGLGMGVAAGDVDNDGRTDVLITEYHGIRLLHNRGDGKFVEVTTEAGLSNPHWGTSAAFFDYDRDGWLDLIVVNYVDYSPTTKCQDPQGKPAYCGPSGFPGTVSRLFRNTGVRNGAPRFEDVTVRVGLGRLPGPGLGVIAADFNADRWPDLFIANDGHVNWLLINQRDGTFTEEAAARGLAYNAMGAVEANMGIALADVDADNLFDILITHLSTETHTLWKQGPAGYFQDRTAASRVAATPWRGTGFGTVFTDLNNDGAPDLAVVNGGIKRLTFEPGPRGRVSTNEFWLGYEQRSQILTNDGRGVFTDVSEANLDFSGVSAVARGLAVGDLDNDGGPDLLVTRIGAPARLFRNIAPRGHWLTVRAIDPALGGRDAYGAEITLLAGGRRRTLTVAPSQSYLCSNDPRAHFGLGVVQRVESIQIIWPDGAEEEFAGTSADQFITLSKGAGRRPNAAPAQSPPAASNALPARDQPSSQGNR